MKEETAIQTTCNVPALWLEHKAALYSFIIKRVKDADLAADILQDVLMKVYQFCLSKSGVANVKSWLFQIANNTIADHYRKSSRFATEDDLPQVEAESDNDAFKDALNYIGPMLSFLPPEYAEPLKLADIDGVKQAEIASRLGLSLSATKSRIQRARQLLKAEFITCCHFETDATGNIMSFSIKESCAPLQKVKKNLPK